MGDLNCLNCGNQISTQMKLVRMLTCDGCGTTLYVQDKALLDAGHAGEMHDGPMLFGLGDHVRFSKTHVDILGHARFSYGRGWWDEFWGMDGRGNSLWISVDEGDIVIQRPLDPKDAPRIARNAPLGSTAEFQGLALRLSERDRATCVAVRGSFYEVLYIGDSYDFVNLQGPDGLLVSGEFWEGGESWFTGEWSDPFEVAVDVRGQS